MVEADGSLRRLAVAHVDPSKVKLAQEYHRRFPPDPASAQGVWHIVRTGEAELIPEINDAVLTETMQFSRRRSRTLNSCESRRNLVCALTWVCRSVCVAKYLEL